MSHIYGNGTTTATSGANTKTHFYDKTGIKAATEKNIYAKYADKKMMPLKYGKNFKISKWLHILDDNNMNDQGLDADGNVPSGTAGWSVDSVEGLYFFAVEADATAYKADVDARKSPAVATKATVAGTANNGNQYGSSRNVADVSGNMPTLAEGSGRVNRVGVTKVTLETEFQRYGNFLEYTDEVDMFSEDSVQIRYREELGYMSGQVSDDLVQLGMLTSAGVTFYGGAATSKATLGASDSDDRVSYALFRKISKRLTKNKAMKNTEMVTGSTKIDTKTINKAWYAIIGSDVKFDVEALTEFVPVYKYASAANLADDEIGSIHETRFIESDRAMFEEGTGALISGGNTAGAANDGTNFNAYPILYPTKGSFATVGLNGHGKIKFKAKGPGTPTQEDPYGLKGLFSYNFWHASMALQPERLLVAYVTASE